MTLELYMWLPPLGLIVLGLVGAVAANLSVRRLERLEREGRLLTHSDGTPAE